MEASFTPDELSAARARRFVRSALDGMVPAPVVDDAVLVASELTTNALLHARTPFDVVVTIDGFVRIDVTDGSQELPTPRRIAVDSDTGRGLHVVGQLARRWGAAPTDHGKRVWAELDY